MSDGLNKLTETSSHCRGFHDELSKKRPAEAVGLKYLSGNEMPGIRIVSKPCGVILLKVNTRLTVPKSFITVSADFTCSISNS